MIPLFCIVEHVAMFYHCQNIHFYSKSYPCYNGTAFSPDVLHLIHFMLRGCPDRVTMYRINRRKDREDGMEITVR